MPSNLVTPQQAVITAPKLRGASRFRPLVLAGLAGFAMNVFAADSFDAATGQVTVEVIVVGDTLYRNLVLVPGALISYSSGPVTSQNDVFDINTGRLTLRALSFAGALYSDVVITVERVVSVGSSTPVVVVDTATRIRATSATATSGGNACGAIAPFYWEIGDKAAAQGSGSVTKPGGSTYTASSMMPIASSSKWIYGAYVAERRAGALTAQDIEFLNFRSGYSAMPVAGCTQTDSVASCVARGTNGVVQPGSVGKFYYNGGHMQKHGSLPDGMNLGELTSGPLASEVMRVLGPNITLAYNQPQLAGGVATNARNYAVFLRKLLSKQLQMGSLLGSNPVCTSPATCAAALYTPIITGASWHYSIGHWVEDDPVTGDGAFSSAGLFGFYPWIDASKTSYGVIARLDGTDINAGVASANCGVLLRKAWSTGVAQ